MARFTRQEAVEIVDVLADILDRSRSYMTPQDAIADAMAIWREAPGASPGKTLPHREQIRLAESIVTRLPGKALNRLAAFCVGHDLAMSGKQTAAAFDVLVGDARQMSAFFGDVRAAKLTRPELAVKYHLDALLEVNRAFVHGIVRFGNPRDAKTVMEEGEIRAKFGEAVSRLPAAWDAIKNSRVDLHSLEIRARLLLAVSADRG